MKVAFIGLGNVGGKLAGSLLRNGVDLMVHDLDADLVSEFVARGAKPGGSPAAMMQAATWSSPACPPPPPPTPW
jgi:3-hydroxyisobutyrate dehydrogenase